ncbi:MAG TPA: hypothetical protein VFK73_01345, partial [Paludibacter sp.]|nr:hypothetical protein [Paludibacter sp.]
MNEKTKQILTRILFWTALATSWLTFRLFFIFQFTILLWIFTLIILFVRKSRVRWLLIGLSAWTIIPIYSFLSGTKDYFSGQATFCYVGMPDPEFLNLDRDYRAWNTTSGCVVYGYEPFIHDPNNLAIKLCTWIGGFQKGVYAGIYPDQKETNKLIDSLGIDVKVTISRMKYNFRVHNKNYVINEP